MMGNKWVLKVNSELYKLLRIQINEFEIKGDLVAPVLPKAKGKATEN